MRIQGNPVTIAVNFHVREDWVQIVIKIKARQKLRHQADQQTSGHVQCPGVQRRQGSEPFQVDENQREEGTGLVIKEGKRTRQGAGEER